MICLVRHAHCRTTAFAGCLGAHCGGTVKLGSRHTKHISISHVSCVRVADVLSRPPKHILRRSRLEFQGKCLLLHRWNAAHHEAASDSDLYNVSVRLPHSLREGDQYRRIHSSTGPPTVSILGLAISLCSHCVACARVIIVLGWTLEKWLLDLYGYM